MSNIITTASNQWASRPSDERYTSLLDMQAFMHNLRRASASKVVPSRQLHVVPDQDNKGLQVFGANGVGYRPTHWAFGQLATLSGAGSAANYLRKLPSPMAADCINYGMRFLREIEDTGILIRRATEETGDNLFAAATGPQYGRIWNHQIIDALVEKFGDGVNGQFRVPGEFGKRVEVTKENTTMYASDRDCFIFLADEENRIEMPNRRDGKSGSLARGFYVWNSEVGSASFGIAMFLFDYVCCNRIIWGVKEFRKVTIRHTVSAPDKFIDQVQPILLQYIKSSPMPVVETIKAAQAAKLDDANAWLAKRYTVQAAAQYQAIHKAEEGRPIESMWDAVTAMTAAARGREHQDRRVQLEAEAGKILDLVANP